MQREAARRKNEGGWRHAFVAFVYSWRGLRAAWCHEVAFRQEVIVFVLALPAAWLLGRTSSEQALLVAVTLAVLVVELLNSAIEAVCDLVHPEAHPLVARAKDLGSAAVLLSIACAALVWGGVLWLRFVGG